MVTIRGPSSVVTWGRAVLLILKTVRAKLSRLRVPSRPSSLDKTFRSRPVLVPPWRTPIFLVRLITVPSTARAAAPLPALATVTTAGTRFISVFSVKGKHPFIRQFGSVAFDFPFDSCSVTASSPVKVMTGTSSSRPTVGVVGEQQCEAQRSTAALTYGVYRLWGTTILFQPGRTKDPSREYFRSSRYKETKIYGLYAP